MEISRLLSEKIAETVSEIFGLQINSDEVEVSHASNKIWGDYSTNIAMKLANKVKQAPGEIAKKLSYEVSQSSTTWRFPDFDGEIFEKIDYQDPGFINFTLSESFLAWTALNQNYSFEEIQKNTITGLYRGKNVLFEYTDPNPFKVLHIGHLMTNAIGESMSRIYEITGSNVKRANYQGDVGMHVAKSIWGVIKNLEKEGQDFSEIEKLGLNDRVGYFARGYVLGSKSYEEDEASKEEIQQLNYLVYIAAQERLQEEESWSPVVDYKKFLNNGHKFSYDQVKDLYYKGRKWSLEHFEGMYKLLGTKFDMYFFESMVGEYGLNLVNDNTKTGVFKEDQGAVIFPGEESGLHTRVFVNSFGLPTYEAKDLGLALLKSETFKYDLSFVITANEINEYFKVVLAAMKKLKPDLADKTVHIGHGILRFKEGKMSSRTGEVISAEEFIADVKEAVLEQMQSASSGETLSLQESEAVSQQLAVGAIKYSILRQGMGKDIIFDRKQSISVTGNTGPYLQYTHARANSILEKAQNWNYDPDYVLYDSAGASAVFHEKERDVARHLSKFHEVLNMSVSTNSVNLICEYLFELAQNYNSLYNDLPILTEEDARSKTLRLQITRQVKDLIKTGLWMLGIQAPDRV